MKTVQILCVSLFMLITGVASAAVEILIRSEAGSPTNVEASSPNKIEPYENVDRVITEKYVQTAIPFNRKTTRLNIEIFSEKRSKVTYETNNKGVLYPSNKNNELVFSRPGTSQYINFNVTQPTSGVINIFNSNKELIETIHYNVVKESPYRHRASIGFNKDLDDSSSTSDDYNSRISYSISNKTRRSTDKNWSLTSSLSASDGFDDKNVSVTWGVSW